MLSEKKEIWQCGCGMRNEESFCAVCLEPKPEPENLSSRIAKMQVGGDHYARSAVEPFDLIKAMESSGDAFVDFARGNVIKYAWRKKTSMLEDLKKARHYIDEAIARLEAK